MAPLQNPCRRVSQKTQSTTQVPPLSFCSGSSQRANLRLALDLLPKRAGLKLAHPQALAPGHLKNMLWGKLPAATAFILVNLAGGVQRVTPGLFTPAGMNGPGSGCRHGYNFS